MTQHAKNGLYWATIKVVNVCPWKGAFCPRAIPFAQKISMFSPSLEGILISTESRMTRVARISGAVIIAAMLAGGTATAQQLPSASPGGTCSTPGLAATYGENGMLICSASLTWKPAIIASTPSNDGGLVSTVGQRMERAMATIVDGTAQFVHDMLSPSSN